MSDRAQDSWPFDLPEDATVLADRGVLEGQPVLHVLRDPDDDGWSFLSGAAERIVDGRLVQLAALLAADPGLAELSDLPPGWSAERDYRGGPWQRRHSG
jgi:hypothetical protein